MRLPSFALLAFTLWQSSCSILPDEDQGKVTHLRNGMWFDGFRYVHDDFFIEGVHLTHHPGERRDYSQVDLDGSYVVSKQTDVAKVFRQGDEATFDLIDHDPGLSAPSKQAIPGRWVRGVAVPP